MSALPLPDICPPRMTLTPATILDLPAFLDRLMPAGVQLAFEVARKGQGMILSIREPHGLILAVVDVHKRYINHDQFNCDPLLFAFTHCLGTVPNVGIIFGIDPSGREFLNLVSQPRTQVLSAMAEVAARYRGDGSYDTTGLDPAKDTERMRVDDPDAASILLDPQATYSRLFRPRESWCALVRHRVWARVGFGQGATASEALSAAQRDFAARWTVTPYMEAVASSVIQQA